MQIAQAIHKTVTKKTSKIFKGIIVLLFIILSVVWIPTVIDNISIKDINPKEVEIDTVELNETHEETINQPSMSTHKLDESLAVSDELKSLSKSEQQINQQHKSNKSQANDISKRPLTNSTEKMSKFDFKETITWFVGIFNSMLIGLLTLKKILTKGT